MTNNIRNALNRINQSIDEWIAESDNHVYRIATIEIDQKKIAVRFRQQFTTGPDKRIDIFFFRESIDRTNADGASYVFPELQKAINEISQ